MSLAGMQVLRRRFKRREQAVLHNPPVQITPSRRRYHDAEMPRYIASSSAIEDQWSSFNAQHRDGSLTRVYNSATSQFRPSFCAAEQAGWWCAKDLWRYRLR